MTSAAALAGIRHNGIRWMHQIRLAHLSRMIGEGDLTEAQITAICEETARRVRSFIETKDDGDMLFELSTAADDLEEMEPTLEELRDAYTRLYDLFDFWRIVAV